MRSGNAHLDFDLGLAEKQSSENPVYYAQYAHARMSSIIENAASKDLHPDFTGSLLETDYEKDVLMQLHEFPTVITKAAVDRAPHQITLYVQKLAQTFHIFYNNCFVIDPNAPELSAQRLGLVHATKVVLANALNLIGVSSPTKM
jgi:arginyl-tRNA synthetase